MKALVWCLLFLLAALLVGCGGGGANSGSGDPSSPKPSQKVNHVIIVMMQNSSFDHLFGTFPGANGFDPNAASYKQKDQQGNLIQPHLLTNFAPPDLKHDSGSYETAYNGGKMDQYAHTNGSLSMGYYDDTSKTKASDGKEYGVGTLWAYAKQHSLADNFFASAMADEPANVLYMASASVGSGGDAFGYPELDACTADLYQQNKAAGATITPALTFENVGDQLSEKNISWNWYHEGLGAGCDNYVPQENPFQYFSSTANSAHVRDFNMAEFESMLASGSLPSVSWIQPAPGHSMHPGAGNIADGIEWLDNLVQAVKGSGIWAGTVMIVLWDESGGWYDHVAPPQLANTIGLGARVPVLVISPLAKSGHVSHQQMDLVSILRFVQWNWGLGKLSDADQAGREGQSSDLCDMLTLSCSGP